MPRRSNVERLSPELRAKINELLADPNVTRAQIADQVNSEAGQDVVSTSSVNRYAAHMAKFTERSRQAAQISEAVLAKLGPKSGNVMSKVVAEQLRLFSFDLVLGLEGVLNSGQPDAAQTAADMMLKISKAINELEKAEKLNAERSEAIRKETLAEAAETAEKSARVAGLSAEKAEEIRNKVLGL